MEHGGNSVASLVKDAEDTLNSVESAVYQSGTSVFINGGKSLADHLNELKGHVKGSWDISFPTSGGDNTFGHSNVANSGTHTHSITIDQTTSKHLSLIHI